MSREVTYTYCGSEERICSDVQEMQQLVRQLTVPNATLITNLSGYNGYLDFCVLNDGSIEVEVFEDNDDFARVDISTAICVIEIAMTDMRNIPLREKLNSLPINWLT